MTTPAQQPQDEASEFDRLMALDEAALAKEARGADTDPTPAPAAAGGVPDSGTPAAPDGGGDGGTSANPSGTPAPATPAAAPVDDWLAALPEDVQARIREEREARQQEAKLAEDRYNALHGRLAPTQQALSDAQRRLAQMQQAPATPANPPVQQAGQSLDSFFDSPEFRQYAEDFPGDAKVMRSVAEAQAKAAQDRIAALEGKLNQLASRLESTEQVTSRSAINSEIAELEARHPDWREINESDDFWHWFDDFRASQPKSMRGQYYDDARLAELFNDAEFTGAMIDSYKATRAAPPAPAQGTATPERTQPQVPSPRLALSVAPDVRAGAAAPAAVALESLPENEAFNYVWDNFEKLGVGTRRR